MHTLKDIFKRGTKAADSSTVRTHNGAEGTNSIFPSLSWHVTVAWPSIVNPGLQVYVTVSPYKCRHTQNERQTDKVIRKTMSP